MMVERQKARRRSAWCQRFYGRKLGRVRGQKGGRGYAGGSYSAARRACDMATGCPKTDKAGPSELERSASLGQEVGRVPKIRLSDASYPP
jgi:hypothetical protein